jgi:hypothetical protein
MTSSMKTTTQMEGGSSLTQGHDSALNIEDPHMVKLVTVFFMSHRILAKIYDTDTMESFHERVSATERLILILNSCD